MRRITTASIRGLAGGTSSRAERAGLAPDPATAPVAIVQVYAARCSGWLGCFGVHTWFAVKPSGAKAYTVYEVTDRHLRRNGSAVVIRNRAPDAPWAGNPPALLADRRGPDADAMIERIDKTARAYPYAGEYAVWPGPNSNTFTAYIARAVPELAVDFPPTAIGKDYLGDMLTATAPSGSGFQISLLGLLGLLASRVEGFEVNVLGLTFGIDPFSPALKLPLVGRLGAARPDRSSVTRHIATACPPWSAAGPAPDTRPPPPAGSRQHDRRRCPRFARPGTQGAQADSSRRAP